MAQASACNSEATVAICGGGHVVESVEIIESNSREPAQIAIFDLTHCVVHGAVMVPEVNEIPTALPISQIGMILHSSKYGRPVMVEHRPPINIS